MIDFSLTEEQKFIRKLARDFAQKEMAPRAEHYDETAEYPWEVIEKAHAAGLLNSIIPEALGGVGAGSLEECLVAEELFAGDAGMGTAMLANNLGLIPILIGGNDEQKERFLTPFLEKPIMAAFCLTESGAGSDVANLRTSWRRDGDEYVLNGSKMFITNGGVASLYTVFATAEPGKRNYRAFSAFVVPSDTPGVSTGKKENKMGHRCSDTSEVIFDEVRVPGRPPAGPGGRGVQDCHEDAGQEPGGHRCQRRRHRPRGDGGRHRSMPKSGRPLANRWPPTRRSSSCWPTWRSRSRRPGSSPGRRPGWPTRDCPTAMNRPSPNATPPTSACK